MTTDNFSHQFLILADESANWKVAGLRQLERLCLAINEYAATTGAGSNVEIVLVWRPDISPAMRWRPESGLRFTESTEAVQPQTRVLSTRLFVGRKGLAEFLEATAPINASRGEIAGLWSRLPGLFEASPGHPSLKKSKRRWRFLAEANEIKSCETEFLRQAGKSQDGIVSKFFNRPVSRAVTRQLLKCSIAPTTWTLAIFILPLIAFMFLIRGDYAGFVLGAAAFQLFSMLDGCDGEIARAKYLESGRGARADHLCDLFANALFLIGLGTGLSVRHSAETTGSNYLWEALLCAVLIMANEVLLRFSRRHNAVASAAFAERLYARHHGMIHHSGLAFFGERIVSWLFQLTKRDVSILAFFFLAVAGLPEWILHLWTGVTLASLALAVIAAVRGRNDQIGGLPSQTSS